MRGKEGKEGEGRQVYVDDLTSHLFPKWRGALLILRLFFSGDGFPSDRNMSSLSLIPRGDEAASLWCYRLSLWGALPGAFVAMVAPEHTQDAKNKFQVKLSSCLVKEFSALFVFTSNWLTVDMLWEAGSNTDAMPRISRWTGGGEKFYRLKTARGVKASTPWPCLTMYLWENGVISQDLSFFTGNCSEYQKNILILKVHLWVLILSLKHFCILDLTPISTLWTLAANHYCPEIPSKRT